MCLDRMLNHYFRLGGVDAPPPVRPEADELEA